MSRFLSTYRWSPNSLSPSDGQAIEAFSKEMFGASFVLTEISGELRYLSIRSIDIYASIRSVVSSGMTDKVTSKLANTPIAVKATDGVSAPFKTAYTASDVADSRMGLVIQQLGE